MTFTLANPLTAMAGASDAVRQSAAAEMRAGNSQEAERLLRQHLVRQPADVPVLVRLGEHLGQQGRFKEALVLLQRASAAAPGDGSIRLSLARLLEEQGDVDSALEQIEAIGAPLRSEVPVRLIEAALLGKLGDHDREIAIYEELTVELPRDHVLWMNLGTALKYAGRADDSQRAFRRSVAVRPSFGEGWWSIANLKSARFESADLATMRKSLRGKISADDALHLHFALGKALEDRGRYEQSFHHYSQGNAIRAAGLTPQQMRVTPFLDQAVATFDEALFDRLGGKGDQSRDPIFVVGLQRSGSTLVEQILASHAMIEGTAELMALQHVWTGLGRTAQKEGLSAWEWIAKAGPEQLAALGAEYLDRARPFRRTDRPMFVDKLPANWMMVGLIRLILPNARIVDARRHPMACGFSNFKQHYATGVAFAYSQEAIGHFYADYLRMMEHMDRVQPGAVHHILNERLIDDKEREVRRLLDYVGVPFDPACLESHRTKRAVNTPSAEQVRRPINRDGVDYWRHYETWLEPMRSALGDALDRWDNVPV